MTAPTAEGPPSPTLEDVPTAGDPGPRLRLRGEPRRATTTDGRRRALVGVVMAVALWAVAVRVVAPTPGSTPGPPAAGTDGDGRVVSLPPVRSTVPLGAVALAPVTSAVVGSTVALRGGPVIDVEDGALLREDAPLLPARHGVEPRLHADELVLLDAVTGQERDRLPLDASLADRSVRLLGWGGGGLLAVSDGRLVGLDLDGGLRWVAEPGITPPPVPTDLGDWLIVPAPGAGGGGGSVAVDLRTGELGAAFDHERTVDEPHVLELPGTPAMVLVADVTGAVTAVAPATGRELWVAEFGGGREVDVAEADDVLAVLVADPTTGVSTVFVLDPEDGDVRTRVTGPRLVGFVVPELRHRWAVDARGAAVVTGEGVTITPWRRDSNLLVLDGVTEVALTAEAVGLVRREPDGQEVVEVRRRRDRSLVARLDVVRG